MMEDSDAPNMKETNSKRKHWRGGSKRPVRSLKQRNSILDSSHFFN
jgi:hypothetical protein